MTDERTLRAALDVVDLGIALVDADGGIDYANAAFAEFAGDSAESIVGASVFGGGAPCDALVGRRAEWAGADFLSVSGTSADGSPVEVVVRPVDADARTHLVVVRRGLVRTSSRGRLSPPAAAAELADYLAELTGHDIDQDAVAVAPVSILLLGVEGLDGLRRRHGQAAVEETLRQVAQALVLQKRKPDIVSRFGDEQFLVVAPGTPRAGAVMLAERIRERVASLAFEIDGEPVPVSVATHAMEYRPRVDGSIRDAVERASSALSASPAGSVG